MNSTTVFCTGPGRVMMPGFQAALGGAPCILFLFQGWSVNSPLKYALAFFACFLMGLSNEGLSLLRRRLSIVLNDKLDVLKLFISAIYGVQMIIAYWMMLIVMTYEILMFCALIFGLVVGNFVFSLKILQPKTKRGEPLLPGGTTPCCQGNETQPLVNSDE